MKVYNRIIIFIIFSSILGGCADFRPKVGPSRMQDLLNNGPADGSNTFKLGWRHGCETGISATANRLQRHYYKFKQDYRLVEDPTYYTAWKTGYSYCQRYVAQYLRRNIL